MDLPPSRLRTRVSGAWIGQLYRGVFRRRSDYLYLLAICLAGGYIYYAGLGSYELQTWDEGIYGVIAHQMYAHGHWISPYYYNYFGPVNLAPFLEKPPLVFWLQAISMYAFGPTAFAVRFPSATFAIATGAVVYLFGRELSTRRCGLFASAVFLTTPYLYAGNDAGRTGGVDTAFVFFGTLFVFFAWRGVARRDTRWAGPTWVAAALALLTKGFAFGIYPIVLLPVTVASWRQFLSERVLKLGAVTGLVTLIWPAYMTVRHGADFVETIFIKQVVGRAFGASFVSYPDTLFDFMHYPYLTHLPTFYDPWIYLLFPAIRFGVSSSYRSADRLKRSDSWFLVWWMVVVLAFFSATGNHPWYLLPMYVPGALLLGQLFEKTAQGDVEAATSTVLGVAAALAFSYRIPLQSPVAIRRAYGLQGELPSGDLFLAAIVLGAVALIAVPAIDRRLYPDGGADGQLQVVTAVAVVLFVAAIASPVAFPGTDWDRQQHELADTVQREMPPDATLYLQPETTNQTVYHALAFHAKRPLGAATIGEMNGDEGIRYALVVSESRSRLTRPYDVLAAGRMPDGREIALLRLGG